MLCAVRTRLTDARLRTISDLVHQRSVSAHMSPAGWEPVAAQETSRLTRYVTESREALRSPTELLRRVIDLVYEEAGREGLALDTTAFSL